MPRSCRARCMSSTRCRATNWASCRGRKSCGWRAWHRPGDDVAGKSAAEPRPLPACSFPPITRPAAAIFPATRSSPAPCCWTNWSPRCSPAAGPAQIEAAKFHHPVRPGDTVAVTHRDRRRVDPLRGPAGRQPASTGPVRRPEVHISVAVNRPRPSADWSARREIGSMAVLRFAVWLARTLGRPVSRAAARAGLPRLSRCATPRPAPPPRRYLARVLGRPAASERRAAALLHLRHDGAGSRLSAQR